MLARPFAHANRSRSTARHVFGEYRGQPAVQNADRAPPDHLQTGQLQSSRDAFGPYHQPKAQDPSPLSLQLRRSNATAASHAAQSRLDEANGPAAEMACFPAVIGSAMLAE